MSNQIKVDTEKIIHISKNICSCNHNIREGFSSVENAIKVLDSSWESPAAIEALSSFYAIKDAFFDSRYQVMNNFSLFLNQQVGLGYMQTESVNTKLSDAFK